MKIYPPNLQVFLDRDDCMELFIPFYQGACPNCHDSRKMMIYEIKGGPYRQPEGDVKWLDLNGKSGWYYGTWHTEPCPVCQEGKLQKFLLDNCGLGSMQQLVSIEDFDIAKGKEHARHVASRLLSQGKDARGFIAFHGWFGTGKTHLLQAIINGFRHQEIFARYSTLADLLGEIREKFSNHRDEVSAEDVIKHYKRIRVLAIDELDKVHLTGWSKEVIFRLLDARYQDGDLLTVLAMNTSTTDLHDIELGYLASRMTGGEIVEVAGDDMRPAVRAMAEGAYAQ